MSKYTRLLGVPLSGALFYITYLLASYFWGIVNTPLSNQTLLGIFLCIMSFILMIVIGTCGIGAIGYTIFGED